MARKKNVVKRAKELTNVILFLIVVSGWLLAVYTISAHNDLQNQAVMIDTAKVYLEDKLYIRAVNQYKSAMNIYHTENNLIYEKELLDIYKEAEMLDRYYNLIDSRIEEGTAQLEEYLDLAQMYMNSGSIPKAIQVLKKGMKVYKNEALTTMYESVCYEYSPLTTAYTNVLMPSQDWYIPAYNGKRWGYIGRDGRTILDFTYEEATRFSGNFGVVKINGVYTLIDKDGYWNAVDKNELDMVTAIAGTRIVGVKDGQYKIYSNTFIPLEDEIYDNIYLNDNGLITVEKNGKWAILNSDLKKVTEFQYTDVVVNSKGQIFTGNYAIVADEKGYYLINQKGEAYFENRFVNAKGMEEGLFAVADNSGKWGFADENGEIVVECQYEDVYSFSNRLAAVKYAGEWGYINRYNTMVIESQFTQAYPFINGNALVTDDRGNYRILTLKYYSLF